MKLSTMLLGLTLLAGGSSAAAPDTTLGELRFRFDSSVLPNDATAQLRQTVAYANAHPDARIVLDAHCDPVGTSPYNTGLPIRRAQAVRRELLQLGVSNEQLVVAVYGKEGAHRATHAEDRRVTLWPTTDPVQGVIDRTFAGQGIAVRWERPMSVAELKARPSPVARK